MLCSKSTNPTSYRIPFFAMMKKRPRRKTPVAKFNTSYSFSCTSEFTNRAAEAPSEAARFLPVSLAHEWDTVENADEQLETWKTKRTPKSGRARKLSSSPRKVKVKVRAKESEEENRSKASPKKVKKEKQKKKKRRSSVAGSSSEGPSPKKSVEEKSLTESVKEEPSPKKRASCSTSGEETPKRVIIPEKLFALGAKRPNAGEEGGKQKSYDIAAIKRTLLEQQKSGPPPKKQTAEKTPNPTRPFGRLPGSLLAESSGGSVRPVKRRTAYEPKMKFVKASSVAGGTDAGSSRAAGASTGGAPAKPFEISSTPQKSEEIPMEVTRAVMATSSELEAENAERRPASPKPLLSTFSPSNERGKSVNPAVGRVGQPYQPPSKLVGNNTTCSRVFDNAGIKPLSQTAASGGSGTIDQEGEVEIEVKKVELSPRQSSTPPRVSSCHPPQREEKEEERKALSDKEDVLSQHSTEVDTDVQTDVESATVEQPPAPRDKVGDGPEGANKVERGELDKNASKSTTNLADEEEKSLLEDLYIKFTAQHAIKNSILVKRIEEYKEMNFTREINMNVLKVQLGRLWKTCTPSVFGNIVVQLTKPDYASCHRKLFCDVLFQVIKTEKPNPDKDYEFCERGLPMLTNKQIKVLALLDALSRTEVMADVCSFFANYLYYALFGVGRVYHMPQFSSINLVRFYVALLRQGGLEEKCRLFLFDMLFFKNSRNHIFVCVLIEVWPEVLTWPHYAHPPLHPKTVIDPIVETVVWMINNTGPANCLKDLMVFEARNLLVERCNVRFPKLDGKELVKKLLLQVRNSPKEENLKASTTMGLMLLGKWMDWRWTNNHISFQLLEMLGKCFKAGDNQLLPWVIETIGLVSRVYPVLGRELLSSLFDQIKAVIMSDLITEPLERICCLALVRVGHHLQLQVAVFLAQWRPTFPLDPGVEKIMWNFVGTRGKNFTQKTINYHKKGKIYGQITVTAPAKRRAST